jgi:hypothetical protein
MNTKLANQVLRYVQVSSALGKRALDEVTAGRQAKKTASAHVPNLVQQMLDAGVVKQSQKTAAEQMLGDHGQTLQLLANMTEKLGAAKKEIAQLKTAGTASDRLGSPEKSAADQIAQGLPSRSVVVGARTSEKKGSDNALFNGLGLTQFANAAV